MNDHEARYWIRLYWESPEHRALYWDDDDWERYCEALKHEDAKFITVEVKAEVALEKFKRKMEVTLALMSLAFSILFLIAMVYR